jgi:hypothetical protein
MVTLVVSVVVFLFIIVRGSAQPCRRILQVETVQEQDMCSFNAFSEWLRFAAVATRRVLIIPSPRFDAVNVTATVAPWERCLSHHETTAQRKHVVLQRDASHMVANGTCNGRFRVRLSRCRGQGCNNLPLGLSPCDTQGAVDKCLHLRGVIYLKTLLREIPELSSPQISAVTFTHVARGVQVAPREFQCHTARFNPMRFRNEWHSRTEEWLEAQNQERGSRSYIAAHFRTEKWPPAVAVSQKCWRSIFVALRTAAQAVNSTTIFLASDVFGRTSSTYAMVQDRKKQVQEVVRREIFARGVKEGGLKFLTYSPRDREDEPSPERRKQLRAIIDLLSMAKARLFLHMYGTFGRGADSLPGCYGARAGSCYGNWVVHTRAIRRQPSRFLSEFSPGVGQQLSASAARGSAGGSGRIQWPQTAIRLLPARRNV